MMCVCRFRRRLMECVGLGPVIWGRGSADACAPAWRESGKGFRL